MHAGSSIIQMASNRYGESVVLKLYNCIEPLAQCSIKSPFRTECEAYSKIQEHLKSHSRSCKTQGGRSKAPAVPLMLISAVENSNGQHRDLFGQRLPQCLVLKYGEPLHARMAESKLDVFEVLKVRAPAVFLLLLVHLIRHGAQLAML